MFYEVFIPSTGNDGFDVTMTVEADNWMTALKSGLERTGEGAEVIRNVMCDIKEDNTIHVTDASSRRVFVLKEMGEDAPPSLEMEVPSEPDLDDEDFATQKMAALPRHVERPTSSPALKSSFEDHQSREQTLPRHRKTAPPPDATTPPFEKRPTGKFKRSETPKGTQPPPKNLRPPTGQEPAVTPEQVQQAAEPATGPTSNGPQAPPTAAKSPPPAAAKSPPPEASRQPQPTKPQSEPASKPQSEPASKPQPEPEQEFDPFESESSGLGEGSESWTSEDGRMRIGSSTFEALRRDEPEPKVVRETRAPSGERKAIDIGRPTEAVSQNALEEVFLEIQQIHEQEMSMEQVINFVMDLSMEKVRAEAGSVMFADVNGRELYFATARGPKAHAVMDFRVPMSKGIVGFCAREGVSLAISDAEKDPRFYKEVSDALGYETKNVACAPIQYEGRVYGAIELLNKSSAFTNTEVNVLTYVGRQLAKFVHDLIMAREKLGD